MPTYQHVSTYNTIGLICRHKSFDSIFLSKLLHLYDLRQYMQETGFSTIPNQKRKKKVFILRLNVAWENEVILLFRYVVYKFLLQKTKYRMCALTLQVLNSIKTMYVFNMQKTVTPLWLAVVFLHVNHCLILLTRGCGAVDWLSVLCTPVAGTEVPHMASECHRQSAFVFLMNAAACLCACVCVWVCVHACTLPPLCAALVFRDKGRK